MPMKADELKLDIQELNNLLQQAHRQRCKDILSLEVRKLQTELVKLVDESKDPQTKPANPVSSSSHKCYEVKLNNYGWDQTSTTVKLYITLRNVHQLPKDAVICNFTENTVDLRVLGLENRNYSLNINNLCEDINVNNSYVKVKTDMIIISLAKKVAKDWSHVTGVEKRIKEAKTASSRAVAENSSDPGAGLMSLMKKMYEEGDDDFKRTLAKVWAETQEKKAQEAMND